MLSGEPKTNEKDECLNENFILWWVNIIAILSESEGI